MLISLIGRVLLDVALLTLLLRILHALLAVRRLITIDSPVGRIPTQTDFDDYREVNGVKVPFTVKVSSVNGGQNATRKYTSIELGKPVDEKLFEAPKPQ